VFPQGAVHMLHNTGDEEMKVVCFSLHPLTSITTSFMKTSISPSDAVHSRMTRQVE